MSFNEPPTTLQRSDAGSTTPILVMVDMHKKFAASNDPILLATAREMIVHARQNGSPVFALEYGDIENFCPIQHRFSSLYCGDTHRELMDPLLYPNRYDKLVVLEKVIDDGSALVLHHCRERGFDCSRFQIFGVNTMPCVSETAFGLAVRRRKSEIEVIQAACRTTDKNFRSEMFPVQPNIKLLPAQGREQA